MTLQVWGLLAPGPGQAQAEAEPHLGLVMLQGLRVLVGVPLLPSCSKESPGPSPPSPTPELQALTRAFHYLGFHFRWGRRCIPHNNQPSTSSLLEPLLPQAGREGAEQLQQASNTQQREV